jgi:hypothetical protein
MEKENGKTVTTRHSSRVAGKRWSLVRETLFVMVLVQSLWGYYIEKWWVWPGIKKFSTDKTTRNSNTPTILRPATSPHNHILHVSTNTWILENWQEAFLFFRTIFFLRMLQSWLADASILPFGDGLQMPVSCHSEKSKPKYVPAKTKSSLEFFKNDNREKDTSAATIGWFWFWF